MKVEVFVLCVVAVLPGASLFPSILVFGADFEFEADLEDGPSGLALAPLRCFLNLSTP